jgi:hypothetical protein
MHSSLLTARLLCVIVGALGGALGMVLTHASVVTGVWLGGLYGLVFALLFAPRAVSAGAGLVWGLGYSFILWLALPAGVLPVTIGSMPAMGMLDTARAHFPELVAYVLCLGVPLGVALGTWGGLHPQPGQARFSFPRAVVVGGVSRHLRGLGIRQMDGAGRLLPTNRRIDQL